MMIVPSLLGSKESPPLPSPSVAIGSNSTLLPEKSESKNNSTVQPAGERSWLAVTRVEEMSDIQYDDNNWPIQRPFVSYNTEAPRTVVSPEMLSKIPDLKSAFEGADGCRDGTEVCEVSHGFSEGGDRDNYEQSISAEQANVLRENVPLSAKTNGALLEFDGRLYWVILHTTSDFMVPQMETRFVEQVPIEPVPLQRGKTLQYTVLIKTWATYGAPAEMNLYAEPSSADSGVSVKVEPDFVVLTERSEQKVKLIITPTANAKEGIYDIRIWGKFANTELFWPDNPCHAACPAIKVGDSLWEVRNNAGTVGLGGNDPPEWLNLRLTTDKQVYKPGEMVRFTAYLDNQSPDSSIAFDDARLIINVYPSGKSSMDNVFNVDAWYRGKSNGAGAMTLQPGSTIILAYPFDWNQKILKDGILIDSNAEAGKYTIGADLLLSPRGYALYDEKEITIEK
ncbi:MAG: hypothetical protein ABI347_09785 [Nitrososphaera sp.]